MSVHFVVYRYVPPVPEDETFYSTSGNDDGDCGYSINFVNNGIRLSIGHDYPCNYFCFYPSIPQGSTINECIFTIVTDDLGWGSSPAIYIRFFNGDDPDQPVAGSAASKTAFQNYSKTGSVIWPAFTTPRVAGVTRVSPDLKTILQTVINREGWVSGNRLILYLGGPAANIYTNEFNGQGGVKVRSYDYGSSRPQLYIDWTPPG